MIVSVIEWENELKSLKALKILQGSQNFIYFTHFKDQISPVWSGSTNNAVLLVDPQGPPE
jgi:hypothetical protein